MLPVVVLTLVVMMGALSAQSTHILLTDATADAARLLARGDDVALAGETITNAVAGATWTSENNGALLCVDASVQVQIIVPVPITARSCALAGGR